MVWEGWRREVSPYPDLRRLSADNARVSIWPEMAVEESDQIEILLRISLGRRDPEAGVCRDAVLPGMGRGVLD